MEPSWEGKSIKNRSKRDMKKELAQCPATKGQGSARDAPRDARDAPGNFQTPPRGGGGTRGYPPPHSLARLNLNASPRGASTKYRTKFQGLDKYLLNAHTPLGGGFWLPGCLVALLGCLRSKNLEIVKKMGIKNLQNGGPNPPDSSPEGAKRGLERPKKRKRR